MKSIGFFFTLVLLAIQTVSAQNYFVAASAYPYAAGAYAPSPLAGGVPEVVAPGPAYGYGYGPAAYASVIGKRGAGFPRRLPTPAN